MVERFYDMEEATGSLPVSPTRRLPHRKRTPSRREQEIVQFNQRQLMEKMELNILIEKIQSGIDLTEREEIFYLVSGLEMSEKEAKRIILSKNVKGKLID